MRLNAPVERRTARIRNRMRRMTPRTNGQTLVMNVEKSPPMVLTVVPSVPLKSTGVIVTALVSSRFSACGAYPISVEV